MKQFLTVFIVFMSLYSCTGQTPVKPQFEAPKALHVKGKLLEDYSVAHLSDAMQRLFFILEKGNLVLPENGFFLNLSKEDAQKLGTKDILLVPLFEYNNTDVFYGNYNKEMSFEIIPIPGVEDGYYTKNVQYFNGHNAIQANEGNTLYRQDIFKNPSLKDTITWSWFSSYLDLRHIPQWIEKLNSNEHVTVHHIGCAETTHGGYTFHTYEKMPLSEFAKQRLGYVSNSMELLNAPKENSTKADWEKWMHSMIQYDVSNIANNDAANHFKIPFKESGNALLNYDNATNQLVRLNIEPQYTNYSDQQVVVFDRQKGLFNTFEIINQQQDTRDFKNFFAKNNTLYTINASFAWAKYELPQSGAGKKSLCKLIATKTLILNATSKPNQIDAVCMSDEISYVLYHKENTQQYTIICLNTQTGELLSKASLNEKIKSPQKLKYLPFNYDEENTNGFSILMEINGSANHLVFNSDISLIEQVDLGKNFKWYPHFISRDGIFTDAKRQFYYDGQDNQIIFYFLDKKTITVPVAGHLYDAEVIVTDGKNLRLFYEYGDAFSHGIKSQLLDGQSFQPIGKAVTVYSGVQIENESSENTPTQLSAFKAGKNWLVTFRIDNEWHIVNTSF